MNARNIGILHHRLSNTQVAIERLKDGAVDLELFSYTFDKYESEKQPEVMSKVLKLMKKLSQNGIAVFLTPNPFKAASAKVEFMQSLINFLETNGMKATAISIDRGKFACRQKRPAILRKLCEFFNAECQRLGLPVIYTKPDDFPWYGFYGQCHVLTWGTT